MNGLDYGHLPVLKEAVLSLTVPATAKLIVDCTTGLGGHSGALLAAAPGARLIGLDVDRANLATAAERLQQLKVRFLEIFFQKGNSLFKTGKGVRGRRFFSVVAAEVSHIRETRISHFRCV